jgi:multiple sugar transport system ATP-binding protein
MNFMPATVEGDTVKLPFGDVQLPSELHDAVREQHGKQLIAGIRPEHFEDASLVGDALDRGTTFTANIEVLESMGAELYAHFTVASDATIESQELRELAEDAGGGEVPMAGEQGRIVARLDPASKVSVGQEAELFVDATRLHLFDPENGVNLTVDQQAPPATTGDGAATGAPADTSQDVTGEDPQARGEDTPLRPEEERPGPDRPGGATGGQT